MCRSQYFFEYVLGVKGEANQKADRGTITHKALELLAQRRVCEQEGRADFFDAETDRGYAAADITPEFAVGEAFEHYARRKPTPHTWTAADLAWCEGQMRNVLDFRGGLFDPRNRLILSPEQYFDLPINEPWAAYDFADPHTGRRVRGQWSIKGTIDLVTQVEPNVIEYCDWKTGRRWDWARDLEKSYEKLCRDPQLLLYFYALTRLYPAARTIFVTIFFTQDGGPYTVCFEARHVAQAKAMLRRRFETIRDTPTPTPSKTWKCKAFCHFGKTNWVENGEDTGVTKCDFLMDEVVQLGVDRVITTRGRPGAAFQYGGGGGNSNRDT
jgi:hypothetical protein